MHGPFSGSPCPPEKWIQPAIFFPCWSFFLKQTTTHVTDSKAHIYIYIIYIYKYNIIYIYIPKMMPWHDSRPHFPTGGLFLHIHPCSSSTSCRGKFFRPGSPRPMPYVGVFNMLKRYAKHGDMKTPAFFAGLLWKFWGGKFVFSKWNWIKLASQKSKSYDIQGS